MLQDIVAIGLGTAAVVSAIACVTRRNPVHGAISLMGFFLSLSGLYAVLGAPFVAALQVLIYVGAVLVLFLFTIMLLDLKDVPGGSVPVRPGPLAGAVALAILLAIPLARGGIELSSWSGTEVYRAEETAAGHARPLVRVGDRVAADLVTVRAETFGGERLVVTAPDGTVRTHEIPGGAAGGPTRAQHVRATLETERGSVATGTWRVRPEPAGTALTDLELEIEGTFVWRPVDDAFGSTGWVGRNVLGAHPAAVELVSILLLLAAVGAIALARGRPPGSTGRSGPRRISSMPTVGPDPDEEVTP